MTREFYASTWFIDIDGTIFIHLSNHDGVQEDEILEGTKEFWSKIPEKDCIVLTTGRPSWWRKETEESLERYGLRYDVLLMDLPSGRRILINSPQHFFPHSYKMPSVLWTYSHKYSLEVSYH